MNRYSLDFVEWKLFISYLTLFNFFITFIGAITTKTKFHITVGHETVMGHVHFFAMVQSSGHPASFPASEPQDFDFSLEYVYQEELLSEDTVSKKAGHPDTQSSGSKVEEKCANAASRQFLLVELEKPVTCSVHALVIGSKLDTDIHANYCRLAFHGRICHAMTDPKYKETVLPRLKVDGKITFLSKGIMC